MFCKILYNIISLSMFFDNVKVITLLWLTFPYMSQLSLCKTTLAALFCTFSRAFITPKNMGSTRNNSNPVLVLWFY